MNTLYYHSKPEIDPKGQRKRMTVAMIIVDDKAHYGISKIHPKDTLLWCRSCGREQAEKLAKESPVLVTDMPKSKGEFLTKAKELVFAKLRMDYSPERFKKALERRAVKVNNRIESDIRELTIIEGILKKGVTDVLEELAKKS